VSKLETAQSQVEDALGLEVDEESEDHLAEIADLEAMFDAALEGDKENETAAQKTLQRNKNQVLADGVLEGIRGYRFFFIFVVISSS
jgi:hypothetical protein